MTVLPPGPEPSELVSDEIVAEAFRAVDRELDPGEVAPSRELIRLILETAAFPIVARWQHWEEDASGVPEPLNYTEADRSYDLHAFGRDYGLK